MTKNAIIETRTKLKTISEHITVVDENNFMFSDRANFLIWDDDLEILTIIGPNSISSANADDNRGEIRVIGFDNIKAICIVPDLVKIDEWIGKITSDPDLSKSIKNSFKRITSNKEFV